jgi:ubiquinone biosynthesis protein COQ9
MRINDVQLGQEVNYHGKRCIVKGIDVRSEYVYVQDKQGNIIELHCSRIEPVEDNGDNWGPEDILKREG